MIRGDRAESNRRQTDSQSVSGNQHRIRPQRNGRELNPQDAFTFDRLPTGSRRQSGGPSVGGWRVKVEGSSKFPSTKIRLICIPPFCSLTPKATESGRQGSRTLKARRPHGLANRPGKPYPATFRISGPDGARTHHTDLAKISRLHRQSGPVESPVFSHQF